MKYRIGSVPYLNAKPLVDWFHSPECDVEAELIYAVPSRLAEMLEAGELDVANVSIFELFRNPALELVPGISISADGAVKSVRLFHTLPLSAVRSVALDTSSLTSSALTRILLAEQYGTSPRFEDQPPHLEAMLATCDAGLIIGDLKLFDLMAEVRVYDLGAGWKELTGLPFVYAAWLGRRDSLTPGLTAALHRAQAWGVSRLPALAERWSERMGLPLDRCQDYLLNVMQYGLDAAHLDGMRLFEAKCRAHGLLSV